MALWVTFYKKKQQRYAQRERVFKILDLCCFTSGQGMTYKFIHEQDNQEAMGKIHVTQQFFAATGPQDQFFLKKKTKNPFLTYVLGKCAVFRLAKKSRTVRHTNPPIY